MPIYILMFKYAMHVSFLTISNYFLHSVSCRTMSGTIDSEEAIAVTVNGTDGTTQQSTGTVVFTYRVRSYAISFIVISY